MGSVKELVMENAPTNLILGRGKFVFSNDYSVFDWGKMPGQLPLKGRVLCMLGAFNFELMERERIQTHYLGLEEDGSIKRFREVSEPSNEMNIMVVKKPGLEFSKGKYRYDLFKKKAGQNFLVPLEVIFRNFIPPRSSVRKRFKPKDLGLKTTKWPKENIELKKPMIDFSTKLEAKDRYLSEKEAMEISNLSGEKFEELKKIAMTVNKIITKQAKANKMVHEDGKIELFCFKDELFVADVAGTFDENRFSFKGMEISKEVIRQHYKKTQPKWVEAIDKAKKKAEEKNKSDWKQFVKTKPEPLSSELAELVSEMYCAGANTYMGKNIFEARDLEKVLKDIGAWKK